MKEAGTDYPAHQSEVGSVPEFTYKSHMKTFSQAIYPGKS